MLFDDELAQLSRSVVDLLGRDAFSEALNRATDEACKQARPVSPALVEELGLTDTEGKESIPTAAFRDALKSELRRLLRPH
jgi:hypothetical protein